MSEGIFYSLDSELRGTISKQHFGGAEFQLAKKLVQNSQTLLPTYPYLFRYEWDVIPDWSHTGCGDLVFTDGRGNYAIVEVKHIPQSSGRTIRTRRNRKRKDVIIQARWYARNFTTHFHRTMNVSFPLQKIEGYTFTNESYYPKRVFPETYIKRFQIHFYVFPYSATKVKNKPSSEQTQ